MMPLWWQHLICLARIFAKKYLAPSERRKPGSITREINFIPIIIVMMMRDDGHRQLQRGNPLEKKTASHMQMMMRFVPQSSPLAPLLANPFISAKQNHGIILGQEQEAAFFAVKQRKKRSKFVSKIITNRRQIIILTSHTHNSYPSHTCHLVMSCGQENVMPFVNQLASQCVKIPGPDKRASEGGLLPLLSKWQAKD